MLPNAQRFTVLLKSNGYVVLKLQSNDRCVDVAGGRTDINNPLNIWSCNGDGIYAANQQWQVQSQGGHRYQLAFVKDTTKCLGFDYYNKAVLKACDASTEMYFAVPTDGDPGSGKIQLSFVITF